MKVTSKKPLILVSVLAAMLAGAVTAKAESEAAWPRSNSVYGLNGASWVDGFRGPYAHPAPATTYNAWTDSFIPFGSSAAATSADKGGQSPTPAAELDALQRDYRAYWAARNRELITADGELAPVLPVRAHERLNAKAFGSPVMSGAQ